MKTKHVYKRFGLLLGTAILSALSGAYAQNCGPANTIYAIASSNQQTLARIDSATGDTTLVGNIFDGGNAATDPFPATSAIAVDPTTGMIWFITRGPGNIYSYTPGAANPYGSTTATSGFSGAINKAAYNPADGNIYFHNASTNALYQFNPTTPNTAPVVLGGLGVSGSSTDVNSFAGGDIVFDGLGNLIGAFSGLNALVVFPAIYNANGIYQGVDTAQGVLLVSPITPSASAAFLPGGDMLIGGDAGVIRINTSTASQTTLSAFKTVDFASCAAPVPNIQVSQTASGSCTGTNQATFTFTITVKNTGQFAAINSHLFDPLPAGLTLTAATLNGTAIPGANNALFSTGNGPLISSTGANAFQNGILERGDSAVIVLTATGVPGTYTNQAGTYYTGVEKMNLPDDRIPSDNPATAAANDPTVVTGGCSALSGTLFNDANGMNNNLVDGTATGSPGGTQMYINLVNSSGMVIASVPVNADGTYNLSNIPDGSFTAQLSSIPGKVGEAAPAQSLPAGWVNTGESFAGANDATVGGGLPLTVNGNNTNANFGIERLPESYAITRAITGTPVLTNLGSQPLQGSDPEDQAAQGSWSGKTIVIDTLPTNGYILKYNGVAVTAGTPIANYNPTLLTIEPGATSGGTATTTFKYSAIDAAGKKDPTPAAYTVNWSSPLPAQLIRFTAAAGADCSTILEWATAQEDRLKQYEVQRSEDGMAFTSIGTVSPKGSYSNYQFIDPHTNGNSLYFYRLKITDLDGKSVHSTIVTMGSNCSTLLSIYPNPAGNKITITGLTAEQTRLQLFSIEGKQIAESLLNKGTVQFDLSTLPAGNYHLVFTADGNSQTIKLQKK